jgi:hypothetical protein
VGVWAKAASDSRPQIAIAKANLFMLMITP